MFKFKPTAPLTVGTDTNETLTTKKYVDDKVKDVSIPLVDGGKPWSTYEDGKED